MGVLAHFLEDYKREAITAPSTARVNAARDEEDCVAAPVAGGGVVEAVVLVLGLEEVVLDGGKEALLLASPWKAVKLLGPVTGAFTAKTMPC